MVYSPLALDDLDGIWDYLAVDQGVPSAARAVVGAIVDRVSQLSEGLGLYLPDTLPSDVEFLSDLLKGPRMSVLKTEAKDYDLSLSLLKVSKQGIYMFPQHDRLHVLLRSDHI